MRRITFLVSLGLTILSSVTWADQLPKPDLGINASLQGWIPFPVDDLWHKDISKEPVDPRSREILTRIGLDKPLHPDFGTVWNNAPMGIPYIIVDSNQPGGPIEFTDYPDESDKGNYPIPANAPIEGGPNHDGDRHVIVIDRDNWKLYELWRAFPVDGGKRWKAGCGAIFDMKKNSMQRPKGWTSADAAGLPIFPGLVRYDEVLEGKAINHALRFTVMKSRRAFVPPALHFASRSNDADLPPMGMRLRLRADFDVNKYPPEDQVILNCLKKYGMILADNGGDFFISGAPDPRWNDKNLNLLKMVKGRDLEVVKMGL